MRAQHAGHARARIDEIHFRARVGVVVGRRAALGNSRRDNDLDAALAGLAHERHDSLGHVPHPHAIDHDARGWLGLMHEGPECLAAIKQARPDERHGGKLGGHGGHHAVRRLERIHRANPVLAHERKGARGLRIERVDTSRADLRHAIGGVHERVENRENAEAARLLARGGHNRVVKVRGPIRAGGIRGAHRARDNKGRIEVPIAIEQERRLFESVGAVSEHDSAKASVGTFPCHPQNLPHVRERDRGRTHVRDFPKLQLDTGDGEHARVWLCRG